MKKIAQILYVFVVVSFTILRAIFLGIDKVCFEFLDAEIEITIPNKLRIFVVLLFSMYLSLIIFLK